MSELNFGIRIGAKDDTQGILRGALSGFKSFAKTVAKPITIPLRVSRKGLAILRDINVGLRPIVAGLDNIIERGTGLEVVRKSFESLTGISGKQAEQLARRMVRAANGTMRFGKAMQIANRGLASGLNIQQILTTLDFISKKAITTGVSAETAIDKVITGLARGSVLFLDDFGLVIDGVEGIARAYDKINGKDAFASLGPAAQKAAKVNQAIKEMKEQLGTIGVSGSETVFVWQGIKNQIGDAVDKLFMAVGKSKSLQGALQGARDIAAGMVKHLEDGGKLGDLLWGKEGGKSGGVFGFIKAGVLDLGEVLGRGILGGLLKGISKLPDLFDFGWTKIKEAWSWAMNELPGKIMEGLKWLVTDFLPELKQTLIDAVNDIKASIFGSETVRNIRSFELPDPSSPHRHSEATRRVGEQSKAYHDDMQERLLGRQTGNPSGFPIMTMPFALGQVLPIAAMGGIGESKRKGLAELAGEEGDELLRGGILGDKQSRTGEWFGGFQADYPPPKDEPVKDRDPTSFLNLGAFPLSQRGRIQKRREITATRRQINELDQSDGALRRQARKDAYKAVAGLQREGLGIRKGDTQLIYEEILGNLERKRAEEREKLVKHREALEGDLTGWKKRREEAGIGAPSAKPSTDSEASAATKQSADDVKAIATLVEKGIEKANELIGVIQGGVAALAGEGARLGRAS